MRYPLFLLYMLLNMFRHGTIPTRGDNTTQSSAPEDGHMVDPKHVEQHVKEK